MTKLSRSSKIFGGVVAALLSTSQISFAAKADTPFLNPDDLKNIKSFLVGDINKTAGVSYTGSASLLNGLLLPLSFYSTPDYWAKFVCGQTTGNKSNGNRCTVNDFFNPTTYELLPMIDNVTPQQKIAADLQVERVNVNYGTDIYDGACWQIGLALLGKNTKDNALFDIAQNQTTLLTVGYDGNANCSSEGGECRRSNNRGYTKQDGTFDYHGYFLFTNDGSYDPQMKALADADHAYFYRMVTRSWLSVDPLIDKVDLQLKPYINNGGSVPLPPNYRLGNLSFTDWKPITGENAWAFLIGPIQADYLASADGNIPFNNRSIQNAIDILPAFQTMQSPMGAIFYAVPGSLGNVGSEKVDPHEVSVENNASTLAGLQIVADVLAAKITKGTLSGDDKKTAVDAINRIYTIIYGGALPNNPNNDEEKGYYPSEYGSTNGMLNFFKNFAWNNGTFSQGGIVDKTGMAFEKGQSGPKAVDVNTWGIAALGPELVDKWFGYNAAYNAWQNVKTWGGFFDKNNILYGVGFADQYTQGGGSTEAACHAGVRNDVMSAEWTAGAITMANVIANYTTDQSQKSALMADVKSMMNGMKALRTDTYASQVDLFGKESIPSDYNNLIPMNGTLGFLYANKRCFIPFGWIANPIPSTTGTAWALMLNYNFNPFVLGGDYNKQNDFRSGPLSEDTNVIVKSRIKDTALVALTLNNQTQAYKVVNPADDKTNVVTIPKGTEKITVSYQLTNGQWDGACTINNPDKLMAYKKIFGNDHIKLEAIWTAARDGAAHGQIECQVTGVAE